MAEKRHHILVLLIISLFLIILAVNSRVFFTKKQMEAKKKEKTPVHVMAASIEDISIEREFAGNIKSEKSVFLYPKIPGKLITEILKESGDMVKKGEILGVMDSQAVKSRLEEAKASAKAARSKIHQAKIKKNHAKKELERFTSLKNKGIASAQQFETMETEYKSAMEDYKSAKAALERIESSMAYIEKTLDDHYLKAPISGKITARFVDQGSLSSLKQPIFKIDSQNHFEITSFLPSSVSNIARPGLEVDIDCPGSSKIKGKISHIDQYISPSTLNFKVRIEPESEKDLSRYPGEFVKIIMNIPMGKGFLIPKQATSRFPATNSWYLFATDGRKAIKKNIEISGIKNGCYIVTSGIKENDLVIVSDISGLNENTPVTVKGLKKT